MKKTTTSQLKRPTLTLSNRETLRELTTSQLGQIAGGRDSNGLTSLNTKSCNTCNLGL